MTNVRPALLYALGGALVVAAGVVGWRAYRHVQDVAIVDKSPAFSHFNKRTQAIRAIVIHHTVTGNAKGTERVLEQRGFSTHFEVSRDGQVIRYMDPDKYAVLASNWANDRTIAIDLTHLAGATWPEVQVAATARLVADLVAKYRLPTGVAPDGIRFNNWAEVPGRVGILRHRNVHDTECPQDFPMQRLGPVVLSA